MRAADLDRVKTLLDRRERYARYREKLLALEPGKARLSLHLPGIEPFHIEGPFVDTIMRPKLANHLAQRISRTERELAALGVTDFD